MPQYLNTVLQYFHLNMVLGCLFSLACVLKLGIHTRQEHTWGTWREESKDIRKRSLPQFETNSVGRLWHRSCTSAPSMTPCIYKYFSIALIS